MLKKKKLHTTPRGTVQNGITEKSKESSGSMQPDILKVLKSSYQSFKNSEQKSQMWIMSNFSAKKPIQNNLYSRLHKNRTLTNFQNVHGSSHQDPHFCPGWNIKYFVWFFAEQQSSSLSTSGNSFLNNLKLTNAVF